MSQSSEYGTSFGESSISDVCVPFCVKIRQEVWRCEGKNVSLQCIYIFERLKENIMNTVTLQRPVIRPLDALWALFESQPKNVRKAFVKRLLQEDVEAETLRQQLVVKQSLTQAFKELAEAEKSGIELPDARNLFK